MKLQSRIVAGIATLALVVAPGIVAAQSALASADATAFLGGWTLTVESPQGPFEQSLELKDVGGKVADVRIRHGSDLIREGVLPHVPGL